MKKKRVMQKLGMARMEAAKVVVQGARVVKSKAARIRDKDCWLAMMLNNGQESQMQDTI